MTVLPDKILQREMKRHAEPLRICSSMCYIDKAGPLLTDCQVEECGAPRVELFDYASVRVFR